ncbi:MAG: enoyl-CoA hydratase/isomerase family protein [Candidatus Nanopelagicales bacterium]|nr:enoyl-CoA hydratase/isomerase family protein [Candidatus Nanopelagicales bacterium]
MESAQVIDGIRLARDGSVARIRLARPEARNAQTPAMWRRMAGEGADLAHDEGVCVVVVDAEGQSFSAGLDRRMFTPEGIPGEGSLLSLVDGDDAEIDSTIAFFQTAFSFLTDAPAISIAAVQGHAVGAGLQLALACDLVVCAEDAQFCMREAAYGLIPDLTGTSPLVRSVGYHRALEMCLTTRWVDATEALALGLAARVVPASSLTAEVDQLVGQILGLLPGTAPEMKALLRQAETASPEQQRSNERAAQTRRLRALVALAGS